MKQKKDSVPVVPVILTSDITLENVNFKSGATVAVSPATAEWLIAQGAAQIKPQADKE